MDSEALVQLALDALFCNQRELGIRLGVSPTQISKWKKGEHMSFDMEGKLRQLAGIGDRSPEFVLWAGSLTEADKWARLIRYLGECAYEDAETGYDTYPLSDDGELRERLFWLTFFTLKEMGVTIPERFPEELDVEYEIDSDVESAIESHENMVFHLIENNPYSNTIKKVFDSLNNVYAFYAAYVSELIDDEELDLMSTPAVNIEPCLMSLAACKIEMDPLFAPGFAKFNSRVKNEYKEWIDIVKDKAFRAGVPLRAELHSLVYDSDDALGHEAEAESLGFNSSRIHPDVYLNELLVGMRVIHQVLPAILKKLGIADDFELDTSELHQGD